MQQQQQSALTGVLQEPADFLNVLRLLNEHEAAEFLGVKVKTLRDWRLRRKGPEFLKLGFAVRYSPSTLRAYISSCRQFTGGAAYS